MKRTLGQRPGHIIFGGISSSELAPFSFPISLGRFPYLIDYTYADNFNFEPIDILRQQSDQRDSPGEHSLNPASLWRRSGESWHLGAGQNFFDREDSSENRFRTSLGLDIWTKYQLTHLPDTDRKLVSANTNLLFAVAGSHFYTLDGTAVKFSTNLNIDTPSFTTVTGGSAVAATSIASDGFNIWTAHVAGGVDKTTRGNAAKASQVTGNVTLLGFVRGRVLAASLNSVYDITVEAYGAPAALPAVLFAHPNQDFVWKAFAEGRNAVYMAGYSGDKSLIYKAVLKEDGTGFDVPLVVGEFEGEDDRIESLFGYLGPFLFIGQSKGWRFANIESNGDLSIGARVETPLPVRCFEGQENFVWWGYSGFDATHTGLGRLNVQTFGDPDNLVPAYTSDIMAIGEIGEVLSCVTFQDMRIFSVSGDGIWAHHHLGNIVPVGTLDTGEILFSMNQDKIGLFVDVIAMHNMEATHGFYISIDDGPFAFLGKHHEHLRSFAVGEVKARTFELRLELKRDPVDLTAGQTFISWLFRALPVPSVSRTFTLPLLIADTILDDDGIEHPFDPWAAIDDIETLNRLRTITQLRISDRAYPVTIETYRLRIHKLTDLNQGIGFNGTCLTTVKLLSEET